MKKKTERACNPLEEMHLAGLPVDVSAQLAGYSLVYGYAYLRQLGYQPSSGVKRGRLKGIKGGLCVEEMYLAGLSPEEIARLLSCCTSGVRRRLSAAGYKPGAAARRPRGHAWREPMRLLATEMRQARERRNRQWQAAGRLQESIDNYYRALSKKA